MALLPPGRPQLLPQGGHLAAQRTQLSPLVLLGQRRMPLRQHVTIRQVPLPQPLVLRNRNNVRQRKGGQGVML